MNRIALMVTCLCGVLACGNSPKGTVVRQAPFESAQDPQLGERDLFRDLEAAVLENYLQLTLGNMEAYADSVARDREVVLIGVSPGTLVFGTNPAERSSDRRPFKERARPTCNTTNGDDDSGASSAGSGTQQGAAPDGSRQPEEKQGAKPEEFPDDPAAALDAVSGAARAEEYEGMSHSCARLIPKTLDLYLARDGSAAWIADEIDYRVPHQGREAAIPLRFTAVLIRDIDRWVVVMEHMSYALPFQDTLELARTGALSQLDSMNDYIEDRNLSRLLSRQAQQQLAARSDAKAKYATELTRRYQAPAPEGPGAYRVPVDSKLLLLPFRSGEYRGKATFSAPTLAELLSTHSTTAPKVVIDDHRLFVSASKQVAWMAANLTATITLIDPDSTSAGQPGQAGTSVTIPLRGTFVFAFDSYGWNIVQTHLSVPVTESQLAGHIFGGSSLHQYAVPDPSKLASKRDSAP